ncbi:MAG: DUF4368 domain-containing protein, partial [Clostridiales bacterium]|nr:DUF4368 domain-containing protein [Clostridiales bacterium]
TQEPSVFSGVLKCPECGGNLNFHFNQGNHDIKFFSCQNHNSGLRKCTKTHYIRVEFLEQVVLYEVNRLACFANEYEDDFIKAMMGQSAKVTENDRARKQRELDGLLARDKELDVLFEKLYEDNVSGKLSDDRFMKMSQRYDEEQKQLKKDIEELQRQCDKDDDRAYCKDQFLKAVRKFMEMKTLTPTILHELVERIDVYQTQGTGKNRTQRIVIHYNFIGVLDMPEVEEYPDNVVLDSRQGVAVEYLVGKAG